MPSLILFPWGAGPDAAASHVPAMNPVRRSPQETKNGEKENEYNVNTVLRQGDELAARSLVWLLLNARLRTPSH